MGQEEVVKVLKTLVIEMNDKKMYALAVRLCEALGTLNTVYTALDMEKQGSARLVGDTNVQTEV
jgi:hypothetical protein